MRASLRSLATVSLLGCALTAVACTPAAGPPPGASASGKPASARSPGGPGAVEGAGIVPGAGTLHWHGCAGQLSGQGMKCASLRVPVDYARPDGRKLTLALSMVPATAPKSQQQGIMLVNPGGPGGSGLALAAEVAEGIDPSVAADYDIVGFDPRGVGSSSPALSCDPSFFRGVRADYVPSGPAAEQALVNRAKMYAADCQKRFGWLLPYMSSQDSARDMDAIRQAFGVRRINYFGFSWGTYLGELYGTMFPGHVRRMVLDSTIDPDGVWWNDNIDQDYAFQRRIEAFFAWTAKYDSTYHLGTTAAAVQRNWEKARSMLKARPAAAQNGKPLMGEDEFDDTYLYAGYLNQLWPGLAQALSGYLGSGGADTSDLISQWRSNGVQDENEFAVYNAVQCADVNWPRSWSYWHKTSEQVYKKAPFQAWDNAWYNAACAFWPVKGPARPARIDGKGLPPILMLQPALDAATPYAGAQVAHKYLPSARMVLFEGDGNHAELPTDTCGQGYLTSYLTNGAVPDKPGAVNATCPAVPAPSPGG